jgi:hypothetical protein
MVKTAVVTTVVLLLICVVIGCGTTQTLTPKQMAYSAKHTAEGAYAAIYGAYLDGAIPVEKKDEARRIYDAYFVAQKTAHDLLIAGTPGTTIEVQAAMVTQLSMQIIRLAIEWGVLTDD